jgi:methylglutaconyl-CoA hydratase
MKEDAAYETIEVNISENVCYITMNRPDVHNAFNEILIKEMTSAFNDASGDDSVRAVVLSSNGKSFCAGADMNWMKKMISYSKEENLQDSLDMATMYDAVDRCTKPVIGRINGAAIGGGVGLVAACDIVVCSEEAIFSFSEVKLGIVPAVISPFIVNKIGMSHSRALFTTAERFGAAKARDIGLVHEVAPLHQLDELIDFKLKLIRSCGPKAVGEAKVLLQEVGHKQPREAHQYTVAKIADLRISDEGQEGLNAFLEKKKPVWRED